MICESTPSCVLMITEDGKFFGIGKNYGFANKSQSVVSVETPTYISISGEKIKQAKLLTKAIPGNTVVLEYEYRILLLTDSGKLYVLTGGNSLSTSYDLTPKYLEVFGILKICNGDVTDNSNSIYIINVSNNYVEYTYDFDTNTLLNPTILLSNIKDASTNSKYYINTDGNKQTFLLLDNSYQYVQTSSYAANINNKVYTCEGIGYLKKDKTLELYSRGNLQKSCNIAAQQYFDKVFCFPINVIDENSDPRLAFDDLPKDWNYTTNSDLEEVSIGCVFNYSRQISSIHLKSSKITPENSFRNIKIYISVDTTNGADGTWTLIKDLAGNLPLTSDSVLKISMPNIVNCKGIKITGLSTNKQITIQSINIFDQIGNIIIPSLNLKMSNVEHFIFDSWIDMLAILTTEGKVLIAGNNNTGQLGLADLTQVNELTELPTPVKIIKIQSYALSAGRMNNQTIDAYSGMGGLIMLGEDGHLYGVGHDPEHILIPAN